MESSGLTPKQIFRAILALTLQFIAIPATGTDVVRMVSLESEPWAFIDRNCQLKGITVELFEHAEKNSTLQFEVVTANFADQQRLAEQGEVDLRLLTRDTAAELKTPGRPLLEYHRSDIVAYVLNNTNGDTSTNKRLAGLDVPVFHQLSRQFDFELITADDYRASIDLWRSGKVDGLVGGNAQILFSALKANLDPSRLGTKLPLSTKSTWLFRPENSASPATDEAIIGAIAPLIENGLLDVLRERYLSLQTVTQIAADDSGCAQHP
jgi:ABC-type amino acid transport substrate-binding protein